MVIVDGCKCFTPAYRFSAGSACTYLPTVWSVFVIRSSNNPSNDCIELLDFGASSLPQADISNLLVRACFQRSLNLFFYTEFWQSEYYPFIGMQWQIQDFGKGFQFRAAMPKVVHRGAQLPSLCVKRGKNSFFTFQDELSWHIRALYCYLLHDVLNFDDDGNLSHKSHNNCIQNPKSKNIIAQKLAT